MVPAGRRPATEQEAPMQDTKTTAYGRTTTTEWEDWADNHCYHCGGRFTTPISSLTKAEMADPNQIDNAAHRACFE